MQAIINEIAAITGFDAQDVEKYFTIKRADISVLRAALSLRNETALVEKLSRFLKGAQSC